MNNKIYILIGANFMGDGETEMLVSTDNFNDIPNFLDGGEEEYYNELHAYEIDTTTYKTIEIDYWFGTPLK